MEITALKPSVLNAMSVDVEDYFHVSALASSVSRSQWDSMEYRVAASTESLLQLFADRRTKATFFVLGWVAEKSPELIKLIAAQGHEIACHGWSHELVYRQEREVFRNEAARCKKLLEDITGKQVVGYRAASYSITSESLWALDDLIDLGFLYDSSIFPIRHDRYGIPGASRLPGRIESPSSRQIIEYPISTVELFGQRIPCGGGGYFRLFPYAMTSWLLKRLNAKENLPFIFYLHPWEVDPQQPRVKAGLLSTFRHYNNLGKCYERLSMLLTEFQFGTVADVLTRRGLLAR